MNSSLPPGPIMSNTDTETKTNSTRVSISLKPGLYTIKLTFKVRVKYDNV